MAKQFMFEIGAILKDEVTGFQGVAMARTEYITGCLQYALCPRKMTKDGTIPAWNWFDEDRLKETGKKIILPGAERLEKSFRQTLLGRDLKRKPSGGPQPVAPSR